MRAHPCTAAIVILLASMGASASAPAQSAFSYQGNLTKANSLPITGRVDMRFSLYNSAAGTTQIGSTLKFDGKSGNGQPIDVSEGIFTTRLDFGALAWTAGAALWLKVEVREPHDPTDIGLYTALPLQPIDSAPFAAMSQNTRGLSVNTIGKIGIGTASPSELLEVEDGNFYLNGDGRGLLSDFNGKRVGFMKYSGREAGIWRGSAQDFEIGRVNSADVTTGTPQPADLYIAGNGNVGIGIVSLAQKLNVAGRIQSTKDGFVFPDGTVQTTMLASIPGDLRVHGKFNGAAGIFSLSHASRHIENDIAASTNYYEVPQSAMSVPLPAGVAVFNWSMTAYGAQVGARLEVIPEVGGQFAPVPVSLFFNTQYQHLGTSGSCVLVLDNPVPNAIIRLWWRSADGKVVAANADDNISWSLMIFKK